MENEKSNEKKLKKGNKTLIVIVIIASILVSVALIICLIYYNSNYPKLEKINVSTVYIKLYVGDKYKIEYDITPYNAKKVNIKTTNSSEEVVYVKDYEITALKSGNSKVCLTQEDNKEIKDCIEITVTTKREEFFKKLDNEILLTKVSEGVYKTTSETFDFNNGTMTAKYGDSEAYFNYVYHFYSGYIDGYGKAGKYRVDYNYNVSTGTLSCLGNSMYFHSLACTYSSQQNTISAMNAMIQVFNAYLEGYSIEDIMQ